MTSTSELKHRQTNTNSMEEKWIWYLAGSFDTQGTIKVKIQSDERYATDYRIQPEIRYSRPKSVEHVHGLVDEYAEEVGAQIRFEEVGNSIRVVVDNPQQIQNFLGPLMPGLIQQYERAEVLLDEVLPLFDDGLPDTRKRFMEVVHAREKLNEYPIQKGESKYDVEYFHRRWGKEVSEGL